MVSKPSFALTLLPSVSCSCSLPHSSLHVSFSACRFTQFFVCLPSPICPSLEGWGAGASGRRTFGLFNAAWFMMGTLPLVYSCLKVRSTLLIIRSLMQVVVRHGYRAGAAVPVQVAFLSSCPDLKAHPPCTQYPCTQPPFAVLTQKGAELQGAMCRRAQSVVRTRMSASMRCWEKERERWPIGTCTIHSSYRTRTRQLVWSARETPSPSSRNGEKQSPQYVM